MLNRQCHGPGRFRDPYLLKAATRVARASCGTWPGWTSRSWLLLAATPGCSQILHLDKADLDAMGHNAAQDAPRNKLNWIGKPLFGVSR